MGLQFSNITRIAFVLFIGFVVSCPLCALIFKNPLSLDVEQYKQVLITGYNQKNLLLHNAEIERIETEIAKYNEQEKIGIGDASKEVQQLQNTLHLEQEEYNMENQITADEINNSVFFLKEIQVVLLKYKMSWLIIFFILLLFALPVFLVQSISANNEYFIKRRDTEKRLIVNSYNRFKLRYTDIFKRSGMNITFYEPFADAPFNTKKWAEPEPLSQEDFINNAFGNSKQA